MLCGWYCLHICYLSLNNKSIYECFLGSRMSTLRSMEYYDDMKIETNEHDQQGTHMYRLMLDLKKQQKDVSPLILFVVDEDMYLYKFQHRCVRVMKLYGPPPMTSQRKQKLLKLTDK